MFFKKQKYRKNPSSKASGVVGGLLLLNVFTLFSILKKYIFEYTVSPLVFILIVILTIILSNLIFNKKRLDKTIDRYSDYSKQKLMTRRIITNLYIVLSIILFFIFMNNLAI